LETPVGSGSWLFSWNFWNSLGWGQVAPGQEIEHRKCNSYSTTSKLLRPNYYILPIETIKHGTNLHTQRLQGCLFTPNIIPPSSCLNSFGFNWRLLVAFFHIVPHFFHFVWRLRYVHPIWFCHVGFLFVNVVATVVLVCKFSSCILYL
jgi:hypothetical protein